MTVVTDNDIRELKELIESLRQENRALLAALQRDLTVLNIRSSKVEGILDSQATLTGKIPDLIEKVGELKNWRSIALVSLTSIVIGVTLGLFTRIP